VDFGVGVARLFVLLVGKVTEGFVGNGVRKQDVGETLGLGGNTGWLCLASKWMGF